jgi:hypothetical protein
MKYTIQIPKPCNENWNEMTPTQKGMFCSNCQKEVVNYEYYSNFQLAKIIKDNQGICGRFTIQQLDCELDSSKINYFQRLGMALGISSVLLSTPIFSQTQKPNVEINEKKESELTKEDTLKGSIEFSGTIYEKTLNAQQKLDSIPLPGAMIVQKNAKNGVQTNIDGEFKISIPVKDFENSVILVCSYIGMDNKEINIFPTNRKLKIEMIQGPQVLMGEVIIVKRKNNIFRSIRNLFKRH